MSVPIDQSEEFREKLITCITQQLQELELLQAMYPSPGELALTDSNIVDNMNSFIETQEYVPAHVDYTISFTVGKLKIEVCVDLPSLYPIEEPDILVRCNQLNRKQQTELNIDMCEVLKSTQKGESSVYNIILWLQDNAENYWSDTESPRNECDNSEKQQFARFWIYSHHIYNKRKRDEIMSTAKDLDLTGFCLSGKPGIICIEGDEGSCKEWWQIIKSMTWKKIALRKTEVFECTLISSERKFSKFEEIHFQNATQKTVKHTDMGQFSKFLEDHGLLSAFQEFFGFNNE